MVTAASGTTRDTAGDTGRWVAGRERVLGARAVVPLVDPAAAFEALCEALGGRQVAAGFVRQMLDDLPDEVPFDHPDDCPLCGTWRDRLEPGERSS